MLIENDLFFQWILKAMKDIEGKEYQQEYYHSLFPTDGSPLVIHNNTAQCTIVIEGEGHAEVSGRPYNIHKGSILLVDAGETHKFWCDKGELILFHVHLPFETMNNDRRIVDGKDFELH